MQMDMSLFPSDSDRVFGDHRDEDLLHKSIDLISGGFDRKLDLESIDESKQLLLPDSEAHNHEHEEDDDDDDDEEEEDEDDDDFTFMYIGDKDSPIYADKAFESGQIRPAFPLFDQNLLLGGEYEVEEVDRLPIHPTVDKIFVKSPGGGPPSATAAEEHEEDDDGAAGPFCVWSKESAGTGGTAELSKKSNSTGFSKLWRIRERVNRSNSDGRDAFVFLKCSDKTTITTSSSSSSSAAAKSVAGAGSQVKVNGGGEKSRAAKAKKPAMSPLEVYLRSKGFNPEDERRRAHHRPAGFYTNVHGGLSRNVHPY